MKCAIMQPTYLPWAGYFNMISSVDLFVFLDDVQFAKRSWQQRNRILLHGNEKFLTIPIMTKGKREQLICQVQTDESQPWREQHKLNLIHAYAKHDFGNEIISLIADILDNAQQSLAEINISIIKQINKKLGISTETKLSSEIPVHGKKSEYLLKICEYLGGNIYLSALGSKAYIEEEGLFKKSGIKVEYHNFIPKPYPQRNSTDFVPYLSIVDVIANLGFEKAREYITS